MRYLAIVTAVILASPTVQAKAATYLKDYTLSRTQQSAEYVSDEQFRVMSDTDPRKPNCGAMYDPCPPVLRTPYAPGPIPGPKVLGTSADNIRIRMIMSSLSHEVLSGSGVNVEDWNAADDNGSSRFHLEGFVIVTCTSDTEL